MKTRDIENLAKLYLETFTGNNLYDDPAEKTLDQTLYTQMRDIVVELKGQPMQTVVNAISKRLDVRIQNLSGDAQNVFIKLYRSVNN